MVSTLFPEMAHSLFQPLLDRLRREQEFTPDEVRALLSGCSLIAAVLDTLREKLDSLLGEGLEGRKAGFLQKEFADVVEVALREAYPRVRAIMVGSTLPEGEKRSSLATLDQFTARATTIRTELEKLQSWLERPAPQVDLAKIIGDKAAGDYEGYVDIAELEP